MEVYIFYIMSYSSIYHSFFLYISSWIAKTAIRLQIEGEGEEIILTPPLGGVKYSCSRTQTVFIKDASSRVSTIPPPTLS